MKKGGYVYMLTNWNNKVLYIGVTCDLRKRVYEHKNKLVEGFTSKYNLNKLVYVETFTTIEEAIAAEKKLKGWLRSKKIALISKQNPEFKDLSEDF